MGCNAPHIPGAGRVIMFAQVNAKEADMNKQLNSDAVSIELDEQSNVATIAMVVVALGALGLISTLF